MESLCEMIVDSLQHFQRWVSLHAGFEQAFSFVRETRGLADHPRTHVLIPDRLSIIVERATGRTASGAVLEAHRRFIDIQFVLVGEERFGWLPLADCGPPSEAYLAERDIEFFADRPSTWIDLRSGQFAIFFPNDAHAPLAGQGAVVKAIAKVAVEW